MLRKWQKRNTLQGALYSLSDRELQDIGTTRGEIEYIAAEAARTGHRLRNLR